LNRESPILKARLFILQEFSTTESTKGTKMKTSENFVISGAPGQDWLLY
jgi:hypothetical protein